MEETLKRQKHSSKAYSHNFLENCIYDLHICANTVVKKEALKLLCRLTCTQMEWECIGLVPKDKGGAGILPTEDPKNQVHHKKGPENNH